jgi:hypothetical protein
MDPVTLIVVALTAGAAAGVKDVASAVVTDAYANLKALARKALASRRDGELVLARHDDDPQLWAAVLLKRELTEVRAGENRDLVAAAEKVLQLVDERDRHGAKYVVDVADSQGVMVGDRNFQSNTFSD